MPADRIRALVTAPFRGEGLDRLRELGDVELDPWIDYNPMRLYGPEQLAERLKESGADVLICEADFCSGPVFDLPLRVIGSTRGDPTNVDVPGATAAGIPVLHAPGRNADGVAEMTIALLFAAARHVVPGDADVRAGEVFRDGTIPYQRFRAWELNGRTAGLVGLGAIGRAVRWRLEGLGMNVLAYDPYAKDANASLDEVIEQSDVISMHAAITPETLGMIGTEQFAKMKDGVIFINAAREDLHSRDALTSALQSGKVASAGLDHFSGEQLPTDHPLVSMQNVVLTPHIGGATYNTEANHSRMIAEDLARLLAGERPQRIANPEVLDK
ncbi:MAG: 3-phosphoglycerate dehydrogenase [Actinobacteria bacterium]|nr:3-phosphoglycerate dehydrogenase [Actinomycetota bacterium]